MGFDVLSVKAAFWRFAHRRYQIRKPSILAEAALFVWGGLWNVVFVASFVSDWVRVTNYIGTVIFAGLPLAMGFMHRRIRIERAKGTDALYRKRISST